MDIQCFSPASRSRGIRWFTHADLNLASGIFTTVRVTGDQVRAAIEAGIHPDRIAKNVLDDKEYNAYWPQVQVLMRQRDAEVAAVNSLPRPEYDAARVAICSDFMREWRELTLHHLGLL